MEISLHQRRQSGFWTNLPVPSQWDVQGFGTVHYQKD